VVNVVASHGFDDGPEGHGSAFGVGGGMVAVLFGDGGEETQVPVAGGLVEGQGGVEVVGGVAIGPALLIEGLDDGVLFAEGLSEAEAKNSLAVREVSYDFADAPFVGCGGTIDLCRCEGGRNGAQVVDGRRQDRDRLLAAQEFCVRIYVHAGTVSRRVGGGTRGLAGPRDRRYRCSRCGLRGRCR
jgi:hypothetical protein